MPQVVQDEYQGGVFPDRNGRKENGFEKTMDCVVLGGLMGGLGRKSVILKKAGKQVGQLGSQAQFPCKLGRKRRKQKGIFRTGRGKEKGDQGR